MKEFESIRDPYRYSYFDKDLANKIYHLPSFGGVLTLESHSKVHSSLKGIVDSSDILVQADDNLAGPEKDLAFQIFKRLLMIKRSVLLLDIKYVNKPTSRHLLCLVIVSIQDSLQHFSRSFNTYAVCCVLQTKSNEPASIMRPERVSPWEIETFVAPIGTTLAPLVATLKIKRHKPPMEIPNHGLPPWSVHSAFSPRESSLKQTNDSLQIRVKKKQPIQTSSNLFKGLKEQGKVPLSPKEVQSIYP
ncbi:hypothetical protein Tco_0180580 [Tanacetum coccineum]